MPINSAVYFFIRFVAVQKLKKIFQAESPHLAQKEAYYLKATDVNLLFTSESRTIARFDHHATRFGVAETS